MPSSIEDLPNELLHYILSYLPPSNLYSYSLAFTCKRLYTATLPKLLSAYTSQLREATAFEKLAIFRRVRNSSNSDSNDLNFKRLPPEQYSELFGSTSQLKELRIQYTITSWFRVAQIWSLCALLSQNVKLELITVHFTLEAGELIADRSPKPHSWFFCAFGSLLRACISHDGVQIELKSPLCSRDAKYSPFSHQVVYPPPVLATPTPPPQPIATPALPPTSLLHRILSFVEARLKGRKNPPSVQQVKRSPVTEYTSPPTLNSKRVDSAYPIPTVPLNTESRLSRLLVAGASTFAPPLYLLLETHLLNPSQYCLTSLSLTDSKLNHYDWHAILQLPAWQKFSRLEHLDVWDSQIPFPDLLDFLQRHPTIVDLNLSRYTAIGKVDFSAGEDRREFLPDLKALNATPEFLIPFLNNEQSSQVRSPLLKTLCITQASSAFYVGARDPLGTKDPLTDSTTVLKLLLEGRRSKTRGEETAPCAKGEELESATATSGASPNVSLYLVSETPPGFNDCLRYALNFISQGDLDVRDSDSDSDAEDVFGRVPSIAPSSVRSLCEAIRALSHVGASFEIFSSYRDATAPELILRVPPVFCDR